MKTHRLFDEEMRKKFSDPDCETCRGTGFYYCNKRRYRVPCPSCNEKIITKLYQPRLPNVAKDAIRDWLKSQSDIDLNGVKLSVDQDSVTIGSMWSKSFVILDHSDFTELLLGIYKRVEKTDRSK